MTELSGKIIAEHLVRKTANQKKAFRETLIRELNERGITTREDEHKGLFSSVNVVAGDAEQAEIIFGAHYDTCPRMPFPNFITPRNPAVFILYQLLLVAVIFALALAVSVPVGVFVSKELGQLAWSVVCFGLFFLMLKGPANPKTYNDNTSGVVGLIELMERMPEEVLSRCAFVFFDNEELGMLGSSAFRSRYKKTVHTPMINMDCIGDGDYLLLASTKRFRADGRLYGAMQKAFSDRGDILDVRAEATVYPSDQTGFQKSLAVAALKKAPVVGYYMDRIHTSCDTVLREDNLKRVSEGFATMVQAYLTGENAAQGDN